MARRGRLVYVLADSFKLGLRPFHAWADLALTLDAGDGRRRRCGAGAVPECGGLVEVADIGGRPAGQLKSALTD
jgi:hypothetical protein